MLYSWRVVATALLTAWGSFSPSRVGIGIGGSSRVDRATVPAGVTVGCVLLFPSWR